MTVVGFALAGGESRRMGCEKALLPWGGGDLLDHALERLSAVSSEVRILAGRKPRFLERGVPVDTDPVAIGQGVPDAPLGEGPLAGLLAALTSAAGHAALVLAIDLPLVPRALLSRLVERLSDFDAVVPVSSRGPEPLCALYGPGCLDPVRRARARDDLRTTAFWPEVRVLQLPPDDFADLGDPEALFLNVNAPEDYESALLRAPRTAC